VICSDKTGTLTQNRMSVSHLVYDKRISMIPGVTPMLKEDTFLPFDPRDPHFQTLIELGACNTEAQFLSFEADVMIRKTKGDASESGLIKVIQILNIDIQFFEPIAPIMETRAQKPKVYQVPFNSSNKWMASIVK